MTSKAGRPDASEGVKGFAGSQTGLSGMAFEPAASELGNLMFGQGGQAQPRVTGGQPH
jgi:hypothetical protein